MSGRNPWDPVVALALVVMALLLIYKWSDEVVWTTDALFYEARVQEFRGSSEREALDDVWNGPHAEIFRGDDRALAISDQALANPNWIPYTAPFFRRRLLVPLAAAIGYPVWHDDGLVIVSMLGFLALTLLLYLMLRMRFSVPASGLAVAICLAWPPLRWAFLPLTDSWGVALEVLALILAVLVVERDEPRWLVGWGLAVLALSFTRDLTPVVLVSALALLAIYRSRRTLALVGVGVAASLPAPIVFGAPLREQLSYLLSGNRIPVDPSWSFVADHYGDALRDMLETNWVYLGDINPMFADTGGLPLMPALGLLFALSILLLLAYRPPRGRDPYVIALRASLLGVIIYLLTVASFSYMRLELAFLPAVAAGLALLADALMGRVPLAVPAMSAGPPGSPAAPGPRPPSA